MVTSPTTDADGATKLLDATLGTVLPPNATGLSRVTVDGRERHAACAQDRRACAVRTKLPAPGGCSRSLHTVPPTLFLVRVDALKHATHALQRLPCLSQGKAQPVS